MRLGALQTGYLPWLGFFDQVERCDLFIVYDDLQYTRKDWRNRNRIKTADGTLWLTVPVHAGPAGAARINEVEISSQQEWQHRHWKALKVNYARADFFPRYREFFFALYHVQRWRLLGELNRCILDYLLEVLGITTPIVYSSEAGIEADYFRACGGRTEATERILYLCRRYGASTFVEGASGTNYIREDLVREAGVQLEYHQYRHPTYPQLFGEFVPYLSVVDLLFNHGDRSLKILTGK